jgi:hypothetical protein
VAILYFKLGTLAEHLAVLERRFKAGVETESVTLVAAEQSAEIPEDFAEDELLITVTSQEKSTQRSYASKAINYFSKAHIRNNSKCIVS